MFQINIKKNKQKKTNLNKQTNKLKTLSKMKTNVSQISAIVDYCKAKKVSNDNLTKIMTYLTYSLQHDRTTLNLSNYLNSFVHGEVSQGIVSIFNEYSGN